MAEAGHDLRFAAEAGEGLGIAREIGMKDLDGEAARQALVSGDVDLAHAPRGDRVENAVRAGQYDPRLERMFRQGGRPGSS